jgi:hypothetical protein
MSDISMGSMQIMHFLVLNMFIAECSSITPACNSQTALVDFLRNRHS